MLRRMQFLTRIQILGGQLTPLTRPFRAPVIPQVWVVTRLETVKDFGLGKRINVY